MSTIDGEEASLADHAGKVLLVVNVASKCGLTPQYEALEALYEQRRGEGFEVLGFPANNFGAQEPGTNEEIAEFCALTYDVKFPLFAKVSVRRRRPASALPRAHRRDPERRGRRGRVPRAPARLRHDPDRGPRRAVELREVPDRPRRHRRSPLRAVGRSRRPDDRRRDRRGTRPLTCRPASVAQRRRLRQQLDIPVGPVHPDPLTIPDHPRARSRRRRPRASRTPGRSPRRGSSGHPPR